MEIKKLLTEPKLILRWVGTILDFFFFFRKHGRQFCSSLFLLWKFFGKLPESGHWNYFWSSVAFPAVLFFGAIASNSPNDYPGPEWLMKISYKLIKPVLNAIIGVLIIECTLFYSLLLYLLFSLFSLALVLRHFPKDSNASPRIGPETAEAEGKWIRSISTFRRGLKNYGKGLLYSTATAVILCSLIIIGEDVWVRLEKTELKNKGPSILEVWNAVSPVLAEHAQKDLKKGLKNSLQNPNIDDLSKGHYLQRYQKLLILNFLIVAAFYIFTSMLRTYWAWFSSIASAQSINPT